MSENPINFWCRRREFMGSRLTIDWGSHFFSVATLVNSIASKRGVNIFGFY